MRKHATVTALMPAYQAGAFIQPVLDSLSAQTHADFSVIVSVDLCADDTYDICTRHAQNDPRFRVIRQDQRLGYVGNCNFLLNRAEADYVLFAFHDDILLADCVQRLADVLDARPEVVMSFCDMLVTAVDGTEEHWAFTAMEGLTDPLQRGMTMLQRTNGWWVPNRGMFRLGEARKIQGLKTHGAGEFSADLPWLFHMSLLGEFARVPETLCHKFYKPGSLSKSWKFSKTEFFEVGVACMREIWISRLASEQKLALAVPLMNGLIKSRQQPQPGDR